MNDVRFRDDKKLLRRPSARKQEYKRTYGNSVGIHRVHTLPEGRLRLSIVLVMLKRKVIVAVKRTGHVGCDDQHRT